MIVDPEATIEGAPELDDEPAYAAFVEQMTVESERLADKIQKLWHLRPLTKREVARRR